MSFWTLVGIVSLLPALVAGDLVQRSKTSLQSRGVDDGSFVVLVSSAAVVVVLVVVVEVHPRMLFFQLGRHLVAGDGLVAGLSAVMAHDGRPLGLLSRVLNGEVELGVHELAFGSVGTEAAQIAEAHDASGVAVAAVGPVPTEPAIVPRAIFDLGLGVNVEEWAIFVAASVEARVEITLGHFRHIKLVKEFTLITFLAQAAKPVFTHDCSVTLYVSEGTCGRFTAVSLNIKAANGRTRLVHARERQRQSTELLLKSNLHLKDNVSDFGHYFFHFADGHSLPRLTTARALQQMTIEHV